MSNDKVLEILSPGTPIQINSNADPNLCVLGEILTARIRKDYVNYECIYWSGNTRQIEIFDGWQISPIQDTNKSNIGFKK